MKIVINSSLIIFLVRFQALELFLNDNYEFYITPSVVTEIHAKSNEISRALAPVLAAEKLIVQSTNLTSLFNRLYKSFRRGQSETIALATELQADFVILDDLAARKIATNLGLNVKGTLGILKKLVVERKIEIGNKDEFSQNIFNLKFIIFSSIFYAVFRDI
ncbi:MAG: DUF3368 domain-containing protein [Trichodesmium sp. MAG_R04]|nr:DUF3368 domain-containing protein [Trichodesmium sp. MAG_R04]